jgi:hypothetical protein
LTAQQGVSGTFTNVVVTSSVCTSASGSAAYSGLSVVINVQANGCGGSSSISPGAIAGIAIGCSAFVALVVVLCVLVWRNRQRKRDVAMNAELAANAIRL